MEKNNFLFVLPTDRIGGAERVASNLVKFLSKNENNVITVYFLTLNNSHAWDIFNDIDNVILAHQCSPTVSRSSLKFAYYLHSSPLKFDYVYSTHAHTNALLSLYRWLHILDCEILIFRETSILSSRFTGVKKKLIDCIYLLYGKQDLIITQTSLMLNELKKSRFHYAVKNARCIPNPVDQEHIRIQSNIKPTENTSEKFLIVTVGRLIKIKNFDLLLKSLALLDKNKLSKLQLHIIGGGPELSNLQELVITLGIEEQVVFRGRLDNPYRTMKVANLGIISSLSEGFPNVLLEMMTAGTADIITTPCTGDLDKLQGLTITEGFSVEEMASHISNSIDKQDDKTHFFQNNIKKRTVDNFWEDILLNSRTTSK